MSATKGAYYQFRFTGRQITRPYATKGPSFGIGAYSIDGGAETLVDHYAPARADQSLVYTTPILTSGTHTLKVRVTLTKNAAANWYSVSADEVVVTP